MAASHDAHERRGSASLIRVVTIFGTRPEVIKLAPVILELGRYPHVFVPINVTTGQHRELIDQILKVFPLPIHHDLDVMTHDQTLPRIVSRAVEQLDRVLAIEQPDVVVVQGDTSTTFVGALSAYYRKIPVAHVEAGLRTSDKYCPFPEEMNRRLVSALADLHFAPIERARRNLLAEGVAPNRIFVTGNTIVDALAMVRDRADDTRGLSQDGSETDGRRLLVLTAHRRESHGRGLRNVFRAVRMLVERNDDVVVVCPMHLSSHVQRAGSIAAGIERVRLIPPLPYLDFIRLLRRSYLILTDSGGIQEEAPSLGKPVIVLRSETERVEVVESGGAMLVGTAPERIVEAVERVLRDRSLYQRMALSGNPFGDGKASNRIIEVLRHIRPGRTQTSNWLTVAPSPSGQVRRAEPAASH